MIWIQVLQSAEHQCGAQARSKLTAKGCQDKVQPAGKGNRWTYAEAQTLGQTTEGRSVPRFLTR
jgi:hypothetical protein